MDLERRVFESTGMLREAAQIAAYLLDQRYAGAAPVRLLATVGRAEAAEGRLAAALEAYRRALAAASPGEAEVLRGEREGAVDRVEDLFALREAAEAEEDQTVRARIFFALGRQAARKGFAGMAAWAYERAARAGGPRGEEAAAQLYRLERSGADRPKIVGLVPLSGRLAAEGFSVMTGAEAALRRAAAANGGRAAPLLRWVDTGGDPERARRGFLDHAGDRTVIGFLGPLTGEEGRQVAAVFGPKSPPVLYLGQKGLPEKPFLYSFGLTPLQEARAVLAHLKRTGRGDLILLYPENGYGRGFAEAVNAAAREIGVRIVRSVSYDPGRRDFGEIIRNRLRPSLPGGTAGASGRAAKGARALPGAVLVADRWERVFLLASQMRFHDLSLPLAGFSGWNDERLIRKAGTAVAGAVFSVDYADAVPGSEGERFRGEYRAAMGRLPSRFEATGYDGALLFAEAWAIQGGREARTGAEAMRDRIVRLKVFRGATGAFQFGPGGDLRRKVSLLRIELGNFVPVPGS